MNKLTLLFLVLLSGAAVITGQDDIKPWERLGLSQTEWKLIEQHNIPMSKVESLLRDGIGIGEYVQKPWEKLKMSESKWISKRRSGLTNYDIELESGNSSSSEWKMDTRDGFKQEVTGISGHGEAFSSLFLPGFQQLKSGEKVKGRLMVCFAGGAVLWCVTGSIIQKDFDVIPIFFVLVPDMVWSYIDYKVKSRKSQ